MSQYNKPYIADAGVVVFIDDQPQMTFAH